MRVAAVVFDLDGTILDSEPLHKASEIEAFRKLGYAVLPEDLIPHVGTTLPQMLSHITPGLTVEAFLQVQKPAFAQLIRQEMEMFPDALRLIHRLTCPLAIATSSMPWYVEETSSKFPILREAFDVVLCSADVERGKPDPEVFLLACERLAVAPAETLVIEDSRNGVLAAKAAGCQVVGVDRHGMIDLSEADRVVESLDDVQIR